MQIKNVAFFSCDSVLLYSGQSEHLVQSDRHVAGGEKKPTKTLSTDCIRPVPNGSKTCVIFQVINTVPVPISGEGNVLPGSRWNAF